MVKLIQCVKTRKKKKNHGCIIYFFIINYTYQSLWNIVQPSSQQFVYDFDTWNKWWQVEIIKSTTAVRQSIRGCIVNVVPNAALTGIMLLATKSETRHGGFLEIAIKVQTKRFWYDPTTCSVLLLGAKWLDPMAISSISVTYL